MALVFHTSKDGEPSLPVKRVLLCSRATHTQYVLHELLQLSAGFGGGFLVMRSLHITLWLVLGRSSLV